MSLNIHNRRYDKNNNNNKDRATEIRGKRKPSKTTVTYIKFIQHFYDISYWNVFRQVPQIAVTVKVQAKVEVVTLSAVATYYSVMRLAKSLEMTSGDITCKGNFSIFMLLRAMQKLFMLDHKNTSGMKKTPTEVLA